MHSYFSVLSNFNYCTNRVVITFFFFTTSGNFSVHKNLELSFTLSISMQPNKLKHRRQNLWQIFTVHLGHHFEGDVRLGAQLSRIQLTVANNKVLFDGFCSGVLLGCHCNFAQTKEKKIQTETDMLT